MAALLHRPQDHARLTLLDLFEEVCRTNPTRIVYSYVDEKMRERKTLTFSELKLHAHSVARALAIQTKVDVGDRVLLVYEPGLDFHVAFWACIVRGAIAVPVAPPNIGQLTQQMPMFTRMASDCGARVCLTSFAFASSVLPRSQQWPAGLTWLVTNEADLFKSAGLRLLDLATAVDMHAMQWLTSADAPRENYFGKEHIDSDSVAVIQYTSGSTADPRGAVLTHGNLVHNVLSMQEQAGTDEHMVFVGWVPHFHDMGLIAGIIHSCVIGATLVTLSPAAFIMRPSSWLEVITKYKATATAAPNFAYELAVRKTDSKTLAKLDLSALNIAVNGAEPVRHSTMRLFAAKFGPVGFRMQAFYPHYGLAEHCVFLSGPDSSLGRTQPVYIYVTRASLEHEEYGATVEIREESDDDTATLVGHGWPHPTVDMSIVNPNTRRACSDLVIGEIWVNSPSCAKGYWNHDGVSADTFAALLDGDADPRQRYLRTGDLAFRANSHLFICGRCRDVFVVRGRNIYPHDVESSIQHGCSLVRAGCVAAFLLNRHDVGVRDMMISSGPARQPGQEEKVVVACEVRGLDTSPVVLGNLVDTVFNIVSSTHSIVLHDVVMLPAHSIAKTTSGKIKRHAVAEAYQSSELRALYSLRLHHRSSPSEDQVQLQPDEVEPIQLSSASEGEGSAGSEPEADVEDATEEPGAKRATVFDAEEVVEEKDNEAAAEPIPSPRSPDVPLPPAPPAQSSMMLPPRPASAGRGAQHAQSSSLYHTQSRSSSSPAQQPRYVHSHTVTSHASSRGRSAQTRTTSARPGRHTRSRSQQGRLRLRSMGEDLPPNKTDVPVGIPRSSEIRQFLVAWVATRMYVGLGDFEVLSTTPLSQLVNSILAVEMCLAVEEWLRIPVPPSLMWEFPTISRLARHLAMRVGGQIDTSDVSDADSDSSSSMAAVPAPSSHAGSPQTGGRGPADVVSSFVRRRHRFFSDTSTSAPEVAVFSDRGAGEGPNPAAITSLAGLPAPRTRRALFQNLYYRSSRLLPIIFGVSILTNLLVLMMIIVSFFRSQFEDLM